MRMIIWACKGRKPLLRMRRSAWDALITELGRRGAGRRESGAFLLCDRNGDPRRVTRVVYFDDLDPACLTGAIEFDGLAYSKLWDICDAEDRRVVGDIHTHPGPSVRQSGIDAENPMIAQSGHIALIVPDYAQRATSPADVGVHRYDGTNWHTWTGNAAKRRLRVRRGV
jgi:proteasome lid subunit RPN8/RPN11